MKRVQIHIFLFIFNCNFLTSLLFALFHIDVYNIYEGLQFFSRGHFSLQTLVCYMLTAEVFAERGIALSVVKGGCAAAPDSLYHHPPPAAAAVAAVAAAGR